MDVLHLGELLAVGCFTGGAAWASIKLEVRHLARSARRAHERLDALELAAARAGMRVVHRAEQGL